MAVQFEKTDTFGGEANYSWVRRHTITIEPGITDLALVRRAKAWAGWSGARCKREKWGDMIVLKPSGLCQILFITYVE